MDLGAYAQIDNLDRIATDNGIKVPRLRGYRLMAEEEPVNLKEVVNKDDIAIKCVKDLCESHPFWNPNPYCYEFSYITDLCKKYYLVNRKDENGYHEYVGVRWDRIHGKRRKVLKTYIHNEIKRKTAQWAIWNKYTGRDDVLYIHARIGGGNWSYYHQDVDTQPWFIEKVDDSFDSTYCDIYARISPDKTESKRDKTNEISD